MTSLTASSRRVEPQTLQYTLLASIIDVVVEKGLDHQTAVFNICLQCLELTCEMCVIPSKIGDPK